MEDPISLVWVVDVINFPFVDFRERRKKHVFIMLINMVRFYI